MLSEAYRCHADIIALPNRLFYENRLVPLAPAERANALLDWSALPQSGVPLVFHDVEGVSTTGGAAGHSYTNAAEAAAVAQWVDALLIAKRAAAAEIGIIAPYAAQVRALELLLVEKFGPARAAAIKVGSVEQFQGQERKVIIITTTRGDNDASLGFVSEPRRANVMMTRAIALLIVVGSAVALEQRQAFPSGTEGEGGGHAWATFLQEQRARGTVVSAAPKV